MEKKKEELLINISLSNKNMRTINTLTLDETLKLLSNFLPTKVSEVFSNERALSPFTLDKIVEKLGLQNKWIVLPEWERVESGDEDFEEQDFYDAIFKSDDISNDEILISTIESQQHNKYFRVNSDNLLDFMTNYSEYISLPILFIQPTPYLFIFLNKKMIYGIHDEGYLMKLEF